MGFWQANRATFSLNWEWTIIIIIIITLTAVFDQDQLSRTNVSSSRHLNLRFTFNHQRRHHKFIKSFSFFFKNLNTFLCVAARISSIKVVLCISLFLQNKSNQRKVNFLLYSLLIGCEFRYLKLFWVIQRLVSHMNRAVWKHLDWFDCDDSDVTSNEPNHWRTKASICWKSSDTLPVYLCAV